MCGVPERRAETSLQTYTSRKSAHSSSNFVTDVSQCISRDRTYHTMSRLQKQTRVTRRYGRSLDTKNTTEYKYGVCVNPAQAIWQTSSSGYPVQLGVSTMRCMRSSQRYKGSGTTSTVTTCSRVSPCYDGQKNAKSIWQALRERPVVSLNN